MGDNANPNPEASTSIDAAPAYYLPAYVLSYYPPAYCPPAYVLPYTDPAYYPPTYVPYALYAAAPVVATHYSPVGYNYAAVMPPNLPTPAEAELPTPTPAIPRQYRVRSSFILNF